MQEDDSINDLDHHIKHVLEAMLELGITRSNRAYPTCPALFGMTLKGVRVPNGHLARNASDTEGSTRISLAECATRRCVRKPSGMVRS
jgi:hypothetical protein